MQYDKNQIMALLVVVGRRLTRWKTPLRPLVLWLWKKTIIKFVDD